MVQDITEERRLIKRIQKEKCNESLQKLIDKHSGICLSVFQKYSSYFRDYHEKLQTLIDNKNYLIYRAALAFNAKKRAKFSTWLGNYARYACLNALNSKENLFIPMASEELNHFVDMKAERPQDGQNLDFILTILGKLKDERISKVFHLRYLDEYVSWSRIAKKMRISTQTAINLHEKGRELLRHKLKSEKCFDEI